MSIQVIIFPSIDVMFHDFIPFMKQKIDADGMVYGPRDLTWVLRRTWACSTREQVCGGFRTADEFFFRGQVDIDSTGAIFIGLLFWDLACTVAAVDNFESFAVVLLIFLSCRWHMADTWQVQLACCHT